MSEDDATVIAARERRRSKRWDERVKLTANFLNGAGIATLIIALVAPFVQGVDLLNEGHALVGLILAITCHGVGQMMLGLIKGD